MKTTNAVVPQLNYLISYHHPLREENRASKPESYKEISTLVGDMENNGSEGKFCRCYWLLNLTF